MCVIRLCDRAFSWARWWCHICRLSTTRDSIRWQGLNSALW